MSRRRRGRPPFHHEAAGRAREVCVLVPEELAQPMDSTQPISEPSRQPILVVGAGPVGLTAALMLARHGTPVRIIDRSAGPTDLSKALVVWQRTMQTLAPVLPWTVFAEEHPILQQAQLTLGNGHSVRIDLPSGEEEAPACVMVPQSDTERVLLHRLHELGVTVERNTELTAFERDDAGVTCSITGPRGRERVRTPWLVACDGAHSLARKGLGLSFPGETVSTRWLLADMEIEADVPPDFHHLEIHLADGVTALFPLNAGRWRLIAQRGTGGPEGDTGGLTIADVQSALDRHPEIGWKVSTLHWTSDFGINERQVDRYVHGRVLLAGDAAHVHSPAGGQGMNTGMQDAANLAWKVALVERGAAAPELLTTYDAERHPVGATVVKESGRMLRAGLATGVLGFTRDHVAKAAMSVAAVRRQLVRFLTEEAINYRKGPLADGTGHRQAARSGDHWGLAAGAQAELVLLGTAAHDDVPDTFGGPHGFPLTVTRVAGDQRLAKALGRQNGAVLVRPDGVVASVGNDAATVMRWATKLLPAAPAVQTQDAAATR